MPTSGARPATVEQYPALHRLTERLVQRAGLPMPELYVIPTRVPNAFATDVLGPEGWERGKHA